MKISQNNEYGVAGFNVGRRKRRKKNNKQIGF